MSWIWRLNIAKMLNLLKLICRLKVILFKNPSRLLCLGIDNLILKITWSVKGSEQPKEVEGTDWGAPAAWLKTYWSGEVIDTVWYWQKDRKIKME